MDVELLKVSFRSIPSTDASLALAQLRWLEASLECLLEQIQLRQVPPGELAQHLRSIRTRVENTLAGGAN